MEEEEKVLDTFKYYRNFCNVIWQNILYLYLYFSYTCLGKLLATH